MFLRVFRHFDSQLYIFFEKLRLFYIKHVIFRLGFPRVHNDFFFFIRTDANLCQKLETLLLYDFVSKAQSQYCKKLKSELKPGEFLVTADFAENCALVVQEAVQAFHWNNNQATLFPLIIYYKEGGDVECCSFVGISDCLKHDTIVVYMFQEVLIKYLKNKFTKLTKIYYSSDGAPQQFKNKKAVANLCYRDDFDVYAEWYFFCHCSR